MKTPSVLFISCDFPPDGSPGAIRNAGFAGQLPKHGFNVSVIRELHAPIGQMPRWEFVSEAERPSAERRVLNDPVNLGRTRSLLSYAAVRLDTSYNSIPNLVEVVSARHARHPFDLIYASCNPLSVAVAGALLKKKLGIPLVTELRDPWLGNPTRKWRTVLHFWWEKRLLERTLSACDAIIMNTPTARANLLKRLESHSEDQIHVIPHSFDSDNFKALEIRDARCRPVTIGFIGSFYATASKRQDGTLFQRALSYTPFDAWNRRLASPQPLFDAYRLLVAEDKSYSSRLRLRFLGSLEAEDIRYAKEIGIWEFIVADARLPPSNICNFLNVCDAMYLTNPFPYSRSPFMATKTVDYIASGKPIVTFLEDSDNRDVVQRAGLARVVETLNEETLARTVAELVGDLEDGINPAPDWDYIRRFERSRQVQYLAEIFRQTLNVQPRRTVMTDCFPLKPAA